MWAVWVVAAIALAACVFMLRFLIALLREGTPSVCYWVAPVRREPEKERYLRDLKNIYVGDDCPATETGQNTCCEEVLEKRNYANEEYSSGFIALDVRFVSDSLGWRAVHSRRGSIFREHRP